MSYHWQYPCQPYPQRCRKKKTKYYDSSDDEDNLSRGSCGPYVNAPPMYPPMYPHMMHPQMQYPQMYPQMNPYINPHTHSPMHFSIIANPNCFSVVPTCFLDTTARSHMVMTSLNV